MTDDRAQDLRHDFELERRLAAKLRAAPASERHELYALVYDQFFRESRNALTARMDPRETARQVRIVTHFLPSGGRYLEIGAGTCSVAAQVALSGSRVQAVEVSTAIASPARDVELIITDGVALPITPGTVDLAFSSQVLEHLHPDDARAHVRNVRRSLARNGAYICITPNRLNGPHDVSKHFGDVAEGFHLREYSIRDQCDLFLTTGFRDVRVAVTLGGEVLAVVPARRYALLESMSALLPARARQRRVLGKLLNPGAVIAYA